jgi:hypothetical protein
MNGSFSRRSMLAGMGGAAVAGTFASTISATLRAAEEAGESAICLSMLYPNGDKAKFDARHYQSKHLPLLKSVYGDSIERIELRTPRRPKAPSTSGTSNSPAMAGPAMGPPPRVIAATSIWIRDLKAFGEKTAASNVEITKDLGNVVTESQPIVQYDKVIVLLGDARNEMAEDTQVFSTYYPTSPEARFDVKYYGEKVIPLMVSLYGAKSIRRIEVTMGSSGQGGAKPAVVAASHFYIRDRAAWDANGMKAYPQLMAEGPKYSTIVPIIGDHEVSAAG